MLKSIRDVGSKYLNMYSPEINKRSLICKYVGSRVPNHAIAMH